MVANIIIEKGVYELSGPNARVKLLSGYKPIQHTATAIVSLRGSLIAEKLFLGVH